MDEVGLGKKLQECRQKAGLTQQQLCQAANLSYSTLAKIERGAIKSPSIFTVQNIATACGTTLNELFGLAGKGSAEPAKKTAKNGVKFVYFDVNGVLVRFFQRAFTKLGEDTGASPDVIESVFWHYNDQVCRGEMSLDEFNELLAAKINVKNVDWQAYYMAAIDPIVEAQETLVWAREHFSVGIMSNIFPGFIPTMQERGLLPNFPDLVIIDSSVVGAIKPEAEIYELATQKAGVAPNEILFIDDGRANLMAAEKHGWHVLWFEYFNPNESVARIKQSLTLE